MLGYLLALLCLVHLAQGTPTNATGSHGCPPLDETGRSVWSILGTCGVTLLICVWHTIHFDVPKKEGVTGLWFKVLCGVGSFFAPEVLVMVATVDWWDSRLLVDIFRQRGYEWSITHSFFSVMNGFVYHYRDEDGKDCSPTIYPADFLYLCEQNKIINPFIGVEEIKDKGKSDWLGKAILTLQLIWFMLQVIVRGLRGLAVTLVELDTVCMGFLSLFVIFLWWQKPLGPGCPHVFYAPPEVKTFEGSQRFDDLPESTLSEDMRKALSEAWKAEPMFPTWLIDWFAWRRKSADEEGSGLLTDGMSARSKFSKLMDKLDLYSVAFGSLCITWLVLGGLHLVAWDFDFPTETEKILWRVASLVLAAGPIFFLGLLQASNVSDSEVGQCMSALVVILASVLGIVSRTMLVGLMLASLRALPCSAHQNVPWTIYIPHL